MREEDIRPDALMLENARLHMEDVRELINEKSKFVEVPCPACESKDYVPEFEKDGFTFVKCANCSTLFINPRPSSQALSKFYATSKSIKHWNDAIFPVSEDARRQRIFAPRAGMVCELYRKHKGDGAGVLLDVGAGFGTFCEEAKKTGLFNRVVAVEPSPDLSETCRRKGLEVIEKPIEDVEIGGVDLITCFELIEHLYRPRDFIKACANVLPKNGLLVLTTPNMEGFDLATLGYLSDNVVGPNHLNYFHPESITTLLVNCGFEVIELSTPGNLDAEIVRKKILSGEYDISCPFLEEVLVKRWEDIGGKFQHFLAENRLSSHMWVVGRKV